MKNRCKNCKHWKVTEGEAYGDCQLITFERASKHPQIGYYKPSPGLLAYAQDASDYMAMVCCEEDFGCVLWEKKEKVTL